MTKYPCTNRSAGCKNCYKCPLNNGLIDYSRNYHMHVVSYRVGNIEYLRKINELPMRYSAIQASE